MTEGEWLTCTDPTPMLDFLPGRTTDRKMRLFVCACCRQIWHLLVDKRSKRAIEIAEKFIDNQTNRAALEAAKRSAHAATEQISSSMGTLAPLTCAAKGAADAVVCAQMTTAEYGPDAATYTAKTAAWDVRRAEPGMSSRHAALLREILGPLPFRPVKIAPVWLAANEGIVGSLAHRIYEERDLPSGTLDTFRLGILADAVLCG